MTTTALAHARELLRHHILIDGHNDLPWAIHTFEDAPDDLVAYDLRRRTPGHTDLARLRRGGVGGQFWSVYVPAEIGSGFARMQLEQVDLAHVAPTTMRDALDTSEAPVIFSHSSARALCDVPRNVSDEILRLVPSNGGVVMVTFVAGFLSPAAAAIMVPAIAKADKRLQKAKDHEAQRTAMP